MKAHCSIARRDVGRLRRERDAIGRHQIGQHQLVTPLLEAVELDRLLEQGIGDGFGIGLDAQTGLALGLDRDVPDRQADQTLARRGIERRPVNDGRLVGIEGVEQHAAEECLMLFAAEPKQRLLPAPGVVGVVARPPRPGDAHLVLLGSRLRLARDDGREHVARHVDRCHWLWIGAHLGRSMSRSAGITCVSFPSPRVAGRGRGPVARLSDGEGEVSFRRRIFPPSTPTSPARCARALSPRKSGRRGLRARAPT